jgi:hypothetical protein
MFPVRFCGVWTLIASTVPSYIGSELKIDYNNICFSPLKRYGFVRVRRNMHGAVFLTEQNKSKIVWLNNMDVDVETQVLPRISFPVKYKCPKMVVSYDIDPTFNWITVQHKKDQFVFRRNTMTQPKSDSIFKIFLTQLLFDFVIRSFH